MAGTAGVGHCAIPRYCPVSLLRGSAVTLSRSAVGSTGSASPDACGGATVRDTIPLKDLFVKRRFGLGGKIAQPVARLL